jgi:hypothetical protein
VLPSVLPSPVLPSPVATASPAAEQGAPSDGPLDTTSSPSDDGTGTAEPTPTEPTPTQPPPVAYTIVAGPATLENGRVSFDFTGDPLPPEVFLKIETPPSGITFGSDGTCRLRLGDSSTAICDTSPDSALVVAPFTRAVSTAAGQSFSVTMPLVGTPTEDTLVTISLSAPEGVQLQTVTALYDVDEPAPTADVAFTAPERVTTDSVGDYSVTATVSGVPEGYTGGATVTLVDGDTPAGSRARFAGGDGCTVTDDLTLTCATIADGPLGIDIDVRDNSVDTPVTLTLSPLEGFEDPNAANNSATVVLEAWRPAADGAVTAVDDVDGSSGRGTASFDAVVEDARASRTAVGKDGSGKGTKDHGAKHKKPKRSKGGDRGREARADRASVAVEKVLDALALPRGSRR